MKFIGEVLSVPVVFIKRVCRFVAGCIVATQIAGSGDVLDFNGFEMYPDTVIQVGSIKSHRNFRSRPAQPRVKLHALFLHDKQFILVRLTGNIREMTHHLAVVCHVFGIPCEGNIFESVHCFYRIRISCITQQVGNVCHGIHVISTKVDFFRQLESDTFGFCFRCMVFAIWICFRIIIRAVFVRHCMSFNLPLFFKNPVLVIQQNM